VKESLLVALILKRIAPNNETMKVKLVFGITMLLFCSVVAQADSMETFSIPPNALSIAEYTTNGVTTVMQQWAYVFPPATSSDEFNYPFGLAIVNVFTVPGDGGTLNINITGNQLLANVFGANSVGQVFEWSFDATASPGNPVIFDVGVNTTDSSQPTYDIHEVVTAAAIDEPAGLYLLIPGLLFLWKRAPATA
jgi:hypothetical protein